MVSILSKLFGTRSVEAETLGILNLCGSDAAEWVTADRDA